MEAPEEVCNIALVLVDKRPLLRRRRLAHPRHKHELEQVGLRRLLVAVLVASFSQPFFLADEAWQEQCDR